jgi:cell division septation protein DedD
MEKSTKHRILGSLVLISLVIILLPFFYSKKALPQHVAAVKIPSFPDQQIQVAQAAMAAAHHSAAVNYGQPATTTNNNNNPQKTISSPQATANPIENDANQPNDFIKVVRPSIVNMTLPIAPIITPIPITVKPIAKTQQLPIVKFAAIDKNEENLATNLRNKAWVIQIGSFKNKVNALRLVNHLRTNGYRAFMKRVQTALGESTRVFVGPEYKQATAHRLASQLENNLHIHGLVVSYKLFAL